MEGKLNVLDRVVVRLIERRLPDEFYDVEQGITLVLSGIACSEMEKIVRAFYGNRTIKASEERNLATGVPAAASVVGVRMLSPLTIGFRAIAEEEDLVVPGCSSLNSRSLSNSGGSLMVPDSSSLSSNSGSFGVLDSCSLTSNSGSMVAPDNSSLGSSSSSTDVLDHTSSAMDVSTINNLSGSSSNTCRDWMGWEHWTRVVSARISSATRSVDGGRVQVRTVWFPRA